MRIQISIHANRSARAELEAVLPVAATAFTGVQEFKSKQRFLLIS
jgi:hypothetical protein